MTKIVLGAGPDGEVAVDLAKLIRTKLLVQANSGGGKSWVIRRLLEQSFGQLQHIVIDPEGEFASLREKFDYVLAAPSGGDTAIDVTGRRGEEHTRLLAHRLLELNASAILDIYELAPSDRARFVRIFFDAMVNAPKALWHPVLIILDEAHNFAPQNGEADSSKAVAAMSSKGRKRGFCLVPATQRLSKLSKDVAAEANNKLIGRSALDVDMKRAAEELGFTTREQLQSLRRLEPGQFFAFGPALTYEVTAIRVGPVVTTHPEAGAQVIAPPAPTAKIRALLPRLADLPAEAEQEARTIEDFKRAIAELRRKLTLAEKSQRVETQPCDHEATIAALRAEMEHGDQAYENLSDDFERVCQTADTIAEELHVAAMHLRDHKRTMVPPFSANIAKPAVPVRGPARAESGTERHSATAKPSSNNHKPDVDLTGPELRILNALAWWEAIGVDAPVKGNVGFIAGYRVGKRVGGNFGNMLGALRSRGLIDYPSAGTASLTDDGRDLADATTTAPTLAALHEAIFAKLGGPERRVLQAIVDVYPRSLKKQDAGEAAGYQVGERVGGNFGNILGGLRSLGLIDYPAPNTVVATELLFPEGLR